MLMLNICIGGLGKRGSATPMAQLYAVCHVREHLKLFEGLKFNIKFRAKFKLPLEAL